MLSHKPALRFVAGLLVAGLLVTPALAATGTVDTGDSVLRVRSEASVAGKVLAKLPHGTQVEVLAATEDGWYQISYKEVTGYVSGDYLKVSQAESAGLPVEESPVYVRVNVSSLNIRSGPDTGYKRTGKLSYGRVVQVLEELSGGWYRIEDGYICAEYTEVVDAVEAASSGSKGQEIADWAMQYLGCAYVYGGSTPRGFDCSGFTKYIYAQYGYSLYRSASDQLNNGVSVSQSELQPGDLVFFRQNGSTRPASHVGLYIGGRRYIHASSPGIGVIVSSLDDYGYSNGYVGARRIL